MFVTQPTPAYDIGDIWIKEDTDLYRCAVSRSSGNFNEAEWVKATDYSNDDYAKNVEAVLNQFKQTVETDYATKVLLNTTKDSILGVVESKTTEVETTLLGYIDLFSVDLDLYNLTIPVNTDKKPLESKTYEVNYYCYYKGIQVSVTPTSSSSNSGITLSFATGKINLTVESNTAISNLTNEFVINFSYQDEGDTYLASKKIVVVLAEKGATGATGPQGIQGIQGPPGADGTSTYFYVKYSENSTGTPMTGTPTSNSKYMGVASTTSPAAPTSPSGYTWSLIKGEDGANGQDGSPGQPGENGQTSYLHIKYSEDGSTFTPADSEAGYALGEKPSAYIGQYVDFTEADSTNFSDYTWYKFTEDIDGTLNNLQTQISDNAATNANNYQDIIGRLDGYATVENVTEVTNRVENLTTSTEQAINIIEDIQTNGVTQVHTETGYSFDIDGLSIEKTNAPTGSKLDEAGLEIKDKTSAAESTQFYSGYVDEEMAEKTAALESYKGQTVTYSNNFIFENYLQSGNGRWEDVEDDVFGKGIGFFIGGGN